MGFWSSVRVNIFSLVSVLFCVLSISGSRSEQFYFATIGLVLGIVSTIKNEERRLSLLALVLSVALLIIYRLSLAW